MEDFYEELYEVDDQDAIKTKGGLYIAFSRKELSKYFGILLQKRSLEQMVGETAYWLLIPSIVGIYSFPIILFISKNFIYTLLASIGLLMSMSLFNQTSYNYFINRYIVRPLANPIPKALINAVFAILLFRADIGIWLAISPVIWWILNDRIPVIYLLLELLMLTIKGWLYKLADPDGVLRQVAIYWAKKHGLTINEDGKITT